MSTFLGWSPVAVVEHPYVHAQACSKPSAGAHMCIHMPAASPLQTEKFRTKGHLCNAGSPAQSFALSPVEIGGLIEAVADKRPMKELFHDPNKGRPGQGTACNCITRHTYALVPLFDATLARLSTVMSLRCVPHGHDTAWKRFF